MKLKYSHLSRRKNWLWKASNVVSYLFGTNSFRVFGQRSPCNEQFVLRKCIVFLFLILPPSYYYLLLNLLSKCMFFLKFIFFHFSFALLSSYKTPTCNTAFSLRTSKTRGTWRCWSKSRGGPWKLSEGLDHLWYKNWLRQLGLFSLEKRMFQGNLAEQGATGELEEDFWQWPIVIGQGVMVLDWKRAGWE